MKIIAFVFTCLLLAQQTLGRKENPDGIEITIGYGESKQMCIVDDLVDGSTNICGVKYIKCEPEPRNTYHDGTRIGRLSIKENHCFCSFPIGLGDRMYWVDVPNDSSTKKIADIKLIECRLDFAFYPNTNSDAYVCSIEFQRIFI